MTGKKFCVFWVVFGLFRLSEWLPPLGLAETCLVSLDYGLGYSFAFYSACLQPFQAVQYLMLLAFLGFPALQEAIMTAKTHMTL